MNTKLYTNSGIGTLYFQPQYTPRQHYAGGGIATLVPRQGYFLGGITRAIGNVLGGAADVVKDVASSPIGQIAAAVLAPQLLPGLGAFASPLVSAGLSLATTGKINPLSLGASFLPGLQFTGGQGLESLIPTGWGNVIGEGTTLSDLVTSQAKNLFSPAVDTSTGGLFPNVQPGQNITGINTVQPLGVGDNLNNTITQNYLTSGDTGVYNNLTAFDPTKETGLNIPVDEMGGAISSYDPRFPFLSEAGDTYKGIGVGAEDTTSPFTTGEGSKYAYDPVKKTMVDISNVKPTTFENLKTIASPSSDVGLSQRLSALSNVGSDAFNAIFYKKGELDKSAVLATLVAMPTFLQAKAKADEIGIPFSEADYQAGKISPSKEKYAQLATKSSFGLKDGGRIELGIGGMSDNRISQIIQLIRDAESVGDMEKAEELRLDLYRETKKADGGRIGYKSGDVVSTNVYRPAKKAYNSVYGYDPNTGETIYVRDLYDDFSSFLDMFRLNYHADGGRIGFEDGKLVLQEGPANKATRLQMEKAAKEAQQRYAKIKAQEQLMDKNYKKQSMYDFKKSQKELFDMAPEEGYPSLPEPVKPEGVLSIKLTPVQEKAYGGMINHPIRMLHGGIPELDLRAKGGFIPVGVKERADDVPAMLSKNEFVFTADAVRNAGNGSINKGAQKMYKLMKSLENKKIKKKVN